LSIQYKHYVIVAYIDFSKASDSVSHEKILCIYTIMEYGEPYCNGCVNFSQDTLTKLG